MNIAEVNPNLQIDFPPKVKDWLSSETELAVFVEGDTLVLKKVKIPTLSTIAERSSEREMPIDEIVEEVHRYRKNKKK